LKIVLIVKRLKIKGTKDAGNARHDLKLKQRDAWNARSFYKINHLTSAIPVIPIQQKRK